MLKGGISINASFMIGHVMPQPMLNTTSISVAVVSLLNLGFAGTKGTFGK